MDLATTIAAAAQTGGADFAEGVVTSYSAGTIQVAVGDPTASPLTAFYLSSYLPGVGDKVVLVGVKGKWVVLGNYGTVPGQMRVRDNAGNTVVEVGRLDDGTYGLAAAQGGQLVGLSQIAFGPTTGTVAAAETTTSLTYTDLTTPGPSVTVTIGSSGRALVVVSSRMSMLPGNGGIIGVAVSGATTIAPDYRVLNAQNEGASLATFSGSRMALYSGLNAGSTTFKLRYAVGGSSATTISFQDREITVFPY